MLSKIDKSIINKIVGLNENSSFDVIIKYKDKDKLFNELKGDKVSNVVLLPFVSSVACRISLKDLYWIAGLKNTKYVSANVKVKSLIYNAKKFINLDSLSSALLTTTSNHTCVVIDTGIYPHIDFLLGKNRIVCFKDFINYKENLYDDNGHGTFVAGVLSGKSIGGNYSGIDSNANIIVIKALDKDGETTSVKILESMQWVLENKERYNIKIVCMSFGSVFVDAEDPLMSGAEMLWNNGIVVVSAAGNSGPNYSTIMSPGVSKKIITVGSLDTRDKGNVSVAEFSSRGPALNNFKPDLVLPGVDIVSTGIFKNKEFYTTMSGTSVSTPMVAGVVSLLFNYNSNYTPDQIKYMLINSTIKVSGDKNAEGFGRLDLNQLKLI